MSKSVKAPLTFFAKLKRFCLTPASPKQWQSNGAEM